MMRKFNWLLLSCLFVAMSAFASEYDTKELPLPSAYSAKPISDIQFHDDKHLLIFFEDGKWKLARLKNQQLQFLGVKTIAVAERNTPFCIQHNADFSIEVLERGQRIAHIKGSDRTVLATYFNEKKQLVLSIDNNASHIWRLNGELINSSAWPRKEKIKMARISPNGKRIVVLTDNNELFLWRPRASEKECFLLDILQFGWPFIFDARL